MDLNGPPNTSTGRRTDELLSREAATEAMLSSSVLAPK
jgi:hypothetical protein